LVIEKPLVNWAVFVWIFGIVRVLGMSKKAQSTVQSRLDRMSEGERNTLTKMTEIEIPEGIQGERITLS
jgi:hypothetical protein